MTFARNKKAFHDYEILDEFEAGISLLGGEVKSIRRGQVQMKGGFVGVLTDGPYVMGMHISPYKFSAGQDLDPVRKRKLLLHQKEIEKLLKAENTVGLTIIPLALYPKGGMIKLKIAIGRGKKQHDKRRTLKDKDNKRQVDRAIRNRV